MEFLTKVVSSSVVTGLLIAAGLTSPGSALADDESSPDSVSATVTAAVAGAGVPNESGDTSTLSGLLAGERTVQVTDGLAVTLPTGAPAGPAELASDGTAVLAGADTFALSAESLVDGTRLSTLIHDETQEMSFTYGLPKDAVAEAQSDGSIDVYVPVSSGDAAQSQVEVLVATVLPGWALDATGQSVKSEYVIDDGSITQVVTPSDETVYPVVADPQFQQLGYQSRIRFNTAETQTISDWGLGAAAGVAGTCGTATASLGPVLAAATGAACGLTAAPAGIAASNAKNSNQCVQVTFTPIPPVIPGTPAFVAWWDGYTGGNC